MSINVDLDYQISEELDAASRRELPDQSMVESWVCAALVQAGAYGEAQLTVRVVDEAEIYALNETYRHKAAPTNVLSFPFEAPDDVDIPLLGDVVICVSVVQQEASQQHKTPHQHWAHMVVHGTLHLLGYDHISDEEADIMESMEIAVLDKLGVPNPYMETETL